MRFELSRMSRRSVLRQICWTCTNQRTTYSDFASEQAGVLQMADTNRQIDAAVHQIDHAGTHKEANLYLGVTIQKLWQDRLHIGERKVCFNCYVQAARRTVRKAAHCQVCRFEIRNNSMGMLEIDLAGLSETLSARRPLKKPRTKFALQLRHLSGN